jgi:outer membrane protein assembly factor BamB
MRATLTATLIAWVGLLGACRSDVLGRGKYLLIALLAASAAFVAPEANASTIIWSTATSGAVDSSPDVTNGIVYVGSNDGALYALSATTGAIDWKTLTGGAVASSPDVVNGIGRPQCRRSS